MNGTTADHRARRPGAPAVVVACVLALLATALIASPAVVAEEPASVDGLAPHSAAASCWEVKQLDPTAADGLYWLWTPTLVAPEQFYCDMTTDGGGWVLVGRGREGWRQKYEGRGTPAQVRSAVTGPAAFAPRQLHSQVIDGLLDGQPVSDLTDGIRVRRARSIDGSEWQEVRIRLSSRDRWVWTFGAEHRVSSWSVDSGTGCPCSGTNTTMSNRLGGSSWRSVDWSTDAARNHLRGWGYRGSISGTTDAGSYMWSPSGTNAIPFSQVFLRPQLTQADLTTEPVPAEGAPATELTPLLNDGVLPTPWGVSGLANGRSGELNREVSAFAQIGDTVYVGGNLRWVHQQQSTPQEQRIEQPYLAAFNVHTGEFVSGFRPQLDDQVLALAALPDGTLAVGGEFNEVNGEPRAAFVRLDPQTGATASGWQLVVENRLSSGTEIVRALQVQGDALYLGGALTHVARDGGGSAYMRMVAKVDVLTGAPVFGWNPTINGTVIDLSDSADGSRVYASGYFTQTAGVPTRKAAAIGVSTAAPVDPLWAPIWSAAADYQQGIHEMEGKVWSGGSEHSLFGFDASTFERVSGSITKQGGDFQTVSEAHGVLYAGCHCNDFNYSQAYQWPNVGSAWTQADSIGFVGAWDPANGEFIPEFDPSLSSRAGGGPWAIFEDSTGNVWVGGDFVSGLRDNGSSQWTGAFMRFAPRDTTAPTTPGQLSASVSGSGVELAWSASTDDVGPVTYEVLRDDRVVLTTSARSATLPDSGEETRWFVRAVDATGNRSATTAGVTTVTEEPEPEPEPEPGGPVTLVAEGSEWSWQYVHNGWVAGWSSAGFDDSGWEQGVAPLGFGGAGVVTDIDIDGPTSGRPLSAQFRRSFEVDDPAALGEVVVSTWADDGVIVFVNGQEIGRHRLPASVSASSWATAAPRSTVARAEPLSFTVPAGLLQAGTNTVSVSMHLNYRATPDTSFDLRIEAAA